MNSQEYSKWVSMWGNAMSITEHRPSTYAKDITLRYPIFCTFSGHGLKIAFDNYCGTEPVTITRASVMKQGVFYQIQFADAENDGLAESIKIDAKGAAVGTVDDIDIEAGETIYVSFYLGDYTLMRSSVVALGPLSSGRFAVGDFTKTQDIPIEVSRSTDVFFFLSNISICTSKNNRSIVCYGDSITAQDWPDYLTLMFKDSADTSIIRRATSGSRILREYDNITYESYGLKGTNRFEHEVPTDGADTVIIQQGINDIIHPVGTDVNPFRPMSDLPTVEQMIDGLKWYIEKAREYGYKVYVGTLLPIEGWRTYELFREDMRTEFNNWIRKTDLIDGIIDFDEALRDPDNVRAFKKEYDSGDHLHPSALGYKKMAEVAYKVLGE